MVKCVKPVAIGLILLGGIILVLFIPGWVWLVLLGAALIALGIKVMICTK